MSLTRFDEDDLIAEKKIKSDKDAELKKCQKLTGNTCLTPQEYDEAHAEFKVLIEIPWQKQEPIYIMPELTADGKLQPALQQIIDGIEQNKPYHTFITESYGITWPLLLRLYYGLKSGFRISIEQLHSMMKISYWITVGSGLKCYPFFETDTHTPSNAAKHFISTLEFKKKSQKETFITGMAANDIPEGERDLQVFMLNKGYLRFTRACYEIRNPYLTIETPYDKVIDELKKYEIKYNYKDTLKKMRQSGLTMFHSFLFSRNAHYRIFFLNDKPCIIFPSQTILKQYQHALHPERNLKFVRLVGKFGMHKMISYTNRNERPVNLVAPGITDMLVTHQKIVTVALQVEHDIYHQLLESYVSQKVHDMLQHVVQILQNNYGNPKVITSEIYRCVDRERPYNKDNSYFLNTLKRAFATDKKQRGKEISLSAVLVLVDIVLAPRPWVSLIDTIPKLFIKLLPFVKIEDSYAGICEILNLINTYAEKTNCHHSITAILFLCHTFLNDISLCDKLLKDHCSEKLFAWRKKKHGNLYPVLILSGKDYPIEELAKIPQESRIKLVDESVAFNKKVSAAIKIQGLFRGYQARKQLALEKEQVTHTARQS